MKNSISNQYGMTLIEVIVAIAISMISLTVLLQLTLSNRTHKSEVDRSIILKEVLTNNAIELKGRSVTDIPDPGNCLVRTYNYQTEFQSETIQPGNPPLCGLEEPSKDRIQVVWEVEPASSINADFSSASLKLPKYSNTLKKVTLHVRGFSSGAGARLIHNQVTLFKR